MTTAQADKRMVAIVVNPSEDGMFNNGLHQNGYFLYRLLEKIPTIQPFITVPDDKIPQENRDISNLQQCFGVNVIPMSLFRDTYRCDVMILGSYAIAPEQLAPYKEKGTKFVAVCWGHKFLLSQETTVFGGFVPPSNSSLKNFSDIGIHRRNEGMLDAIWLSPHFTWTKQYLAATYDMPLHKVFTSPYIWDSELIEKIMKSNPVFDTDQTPYFRPFDPQNKKIYTLEPNINTVKTSLIPFYTVEHLYKQDPDQFDHCHFIGGDCLKENRHFVDLVNKSALCFDGKTHKITFDGRTKLPWVYDRAKVQLAHHFNLGLNYTYLEAAYFHHPIVHNSEFMKDMGYYYRGAAVYDATAQLSKALRHEERNDLEEYNANCDEVVHRFSIHNEENIRGYETLIENLFTKQKPELPEYIDSLESQLAFGDGYFSPYHLPPSYLV